LKELAAQAAEADAAGKLEEAFAAWSAALALLPANAKQRQGIEQRVEDLTSRIAKHEAAKPKAMPQWAKGLGIAAPVILLLLTKGKWLGLAVCPWLPPLDLHSRDGACLRVATARNRSHGAIVHTRIWRGHLFAATLCLALR